MKSKSLGYLTLEQATAIYAYTMPGVYSDFNTAVRNGGGKNYKGFPFKALHFYLTNALKKLKTKFKNCYNVYRGVSMPTKVSLGQIIRFGQFTSTSRSLKVATGYGTATVFVMKTCRGTSIDDYSWFIKNEEVLVPPFKRFQVVAINGNQINLKPLPKTKSIYNCLAGAAIREVPSGGRQRESNQTDTTAKNHKHLQLSGRLPSGISSKGNLLECRIRPIGDRWFESGAMPLPAEARRSQWVAN
ncbi:UNVERIFIED_CONTAM: hypothetical protein FKN15_075010 [Acipenser sinensis]